MGNKYCVWINISLFRNMDIIKYKILLSQNTEIIDDASLSITEKYECISYPDKMKCLFDIDNLEIIARLALGGAMTCIQITCFLQLLGYNVYYECVKRKLIELRNINCIGIYRIVDSATNKKTDAVYLMEDGIYVAKNIGIPIVKGADISKKRTRNDRIKKIKSFVTTNSIILNQLIYNRDELKGFLINQTYKKKYYSKIEAPLIIDTTTNGYIFWQYHQDEHNIDDISDMVKDWQYMENNIYKFVPVIMCESIVQAKNILKIMERLTYTNKFLITIAQSVTNDREITIFCYERVGKCIKELQLLQL